MMANPIPVQIILAQQIQFYSDNTCMTKILYIEDHLPLASWDKPNTTKRSKSFHLPRSKKNKNQGAFPNDYQIYQLEFRNKVHSDLTLKSAYLWSYMLF